MKNFLLIYGISQADSAFVIYSWLILLISDYIGSKNISQNL